MRVQAPSDMSLQEVLQAALARAQNALDGFVSQFSSPNGLVQASALLAVIVIALVIAGPITRGLRRLAAGRNADHIVTRGLRLLREQVRPILIGLGLAIAASLMEAAGQRDDILRISAILVAVWLGVRLVSAIVDNPILARFFAFSAFIIAALHIVELWTPTVELLNGVALFRLGETQVTLLGLLRAIFITAAFIWGATALSRLLEARIRASTALTPSVQTILAQLLRGVIVAIAGLWALNVLGVGVTTLTLFTGALGVALGFGMAPAFTNFVAGFVLLLERTVRVGDFIELESPTTGGRIAGEVRELSLRATLITTNDNLDILIPNAQLVATRVINWTFRDETIRKHIPFRINHGEDVDRVRGFIIEAAKKVAHTLPDNEDRRTDMWVVGLSEIGVECELVVWLSPAAVRRPQVVHAVYTGAIEAALRANGVTIPTPHRDLRLTALGSS